MPTTSAIRAARTASSRASSTRATTPTRRAAPTPSRSPRRIPRPDCPGAARLAQWLQHSPIGFWFETDSATLGLMEERKPRHAHAVYTADNCSIGRTLEIVGERWTLLVLRESFFGVKRF